MTFRIDAYQILLALAVLLSLTLAGCGVLNPSPSKKAQTHFSQTYTCPVERITVAPMEGVSMRQLWLASSESGGSPSAEIRTDPTRLAQWQQLQDARIKAFRIDSFRIFHVSGCAHEETLACECPGFFTNSGKYGGGGLPQDRCSCRAPPKPAPPTP